MNDEVPVIPQEAIDDYVNRGMPWNDEFDEITEFE
jgi:hypothetical protein